MTAQVFFLDVFFSKKTSSLMPLSIILMVDGKNFVMQLKVSWSGIYHIFIDLNRETKILQI